MDTKTAPLSPPAETSAQLILSLARFSRPETLAAWVPPDDPALLEALDAVERAVREQGLGRHPYLVELRRLIGAPEVGPLSTRERLWLARLALVLATDVQRPAWELVSQAFRAGSSRALEPR